MGLFFLQTGTPNPPLNLRILKEDIPMTNEQKNQIQRMRAEHGSYTEIAAAVGLSRETVKKHCQRHPLQIQTPPDISDQVLHCKQCHKEIPTVHGRKQPLFCSTECRRAWWKAHPDAAHPKKFYTITCKGCGTVFRSYGNANRKYCSHACYVRSRFGGGDRP